MKRLRLWLKELSLSQQLLAIIFMMIVSMTLFFTVFLSQRIDEFTGMMMFQLIHRSQSAVVSYIESDNSGRYMLQVSDANVMHGLYDPKQNIYMPLTDRNISEPLQKVVVGNIKYMEESDNHDFYYISGDTRWFYSITPIGDRYLFSIMPDTFRDDMKSALLNTVVNFSIFIFSALLIVLMIWFSTVIHPLNQIRNYINKKKNDQDAKLIIMRKDEIGELAEALVEMEQEIDKQNRVKEEMIQNISHDLKTPIATIKSYAESIKDGIYPYGSLEKSTDVIIEHAERLEKKVYSLILLNKMGYLQDNLEAGENLDMVEIIDKVVDSFEIMHPQIDFIRELDEVCFHGEEEPWRIVVENLVDNAVRYAKTYIKVTLKDGEMCVINDGNKMDEDRLSKLFKPYEKGTDGKFGLGLSIVQKVTSTYGYRVSAENLANGVCFRIEDPKKVKMNMSDDTIAMAVIEERQDKKKQKTVGE